MPTFTPIIISQIIQLINLSIVTVIRCYSKMITHGEDGLQIKL